MNANELSLQDHQEVGAADHHVHTFPQMIHHLAGHQQVTMVATLPAQVTLVAILLPLDLTVTIHTEIVTMTDRSQ